MEKCTMFPYSWHMDEKEEDVTSIRVYGLNESNENICVRINNFTPFVYLELPENIPWTASKAPKRWKNGYRKKFILKFFLRYGPN